MQPIQKFLRQLLRDYKKYQWGGFRRSSYFSGSVTTFETVVMGFLIRICFQNHEGEIRRGHELKFKVANRKGISPKCPKWIEVDVIDKFARFGRKAILRNKIFLPGSPDFELAEKLFDEIKKIGVVFSPQSDACLSLDQSLLGFCDELKKNKLPL